MLGCVNEVGCEVRRAQEWTLIENSEVTSTNLVAAKLPVWHAVRADTQTAGRGRFQRAWVSDAGGLWLSAVVPVETNSPAWRMLPLAAGVAVCDALRANGAKQLRLRWPNDILVGDRKLAGLLIDQFQPGLAVVGVGINVCNQPEARDGRLKGHVARLADLVSAVPSLHELARHVLVALHAVWQEVRNAGGETLLPRVNALWHLPRAVRLDLDGAQVTGAFAGVDACGRLQLQRPDGKIKFYEPQDVRLLRDLD
ncbi:MAG: biotin--[acetyl-CoA-carboxylase] ligase [Verrucomicrobiota bacterium]|nr:biotin--[acetyl-CoA-carboxylase] ligase [Verrucomicrobiota bacterium]